MQTPPIRFFARAGAAGLTLALAFAGACVAPPPTANAATAAQPQPGRLVVLQHCSAADVAFQLRAAHHPDAEVGVLEVAGLNAILLQGDERAVARLEREIGRLDRP